MSRRPWTIVAAMLFAIAWGGNEFTPLLVMYRGTGMDPVVVDFLLFAYVVGIIPGLAIAGPLSDLRGRRPVVLPAPWIAVAGSVLLALGGQSAAMLAAGRVLCGIALGIAMAAGGSWLKELSSPAHDPSADALAGVRRQGLALTVGFAVGAAVAAALAQWAPAPQVTPYVVHVAITVPVAIALSGVPETRLAKSPRSAPRPTPSASSAPPAAASLNTRTATGHTRSSTAAAVLSRRFLLLVLPIAPWVFGAVGTAYAIIPSLLTPLAGDVPIAFSGMLCLIALGSGFSIQRLARRWHSPGDIRLSVLACGFIIVGMALAAWTASVLDSGALALSLGILAAVVLGCGYGTALQSCLSEIQHLADSTNLAALTAVFYSLAYVGFAFPMLLAELSTRWNYPAMLGVGAVVAAVTLLAISIARSTGFFGSRSAHRTLV